MEQELRAGGGGGEEGQWTCARFGRFEVPDRLQRPRAATQVEGKIDSGRARRILEGQFECHEGQARSSVGRAGPSRVSLLSGVVRAHAASTRRTVGGG